MGRSDALGRRAVHRMMRTAQLLCMFAAVVAVGMGAEIGEEVSMLDEADSRLGEVQMLETAPGAAADGALVTATKKAEELTRANEKMKKEAADKAAEEKKKADEKLKETTKKLYEKNNEVKKVLDKAKVEIKAQANNEEDKATGKAKAVADDWDKRVADAKKDVETAEKALK